MKRYYLSTSKTTGVVTVDGQNIIKGVESFSRYEHVFIGRNLDKLLDLLKKDGQVEMMEI